MWFNYVKEIPYKLDYGNGHGVNYNYDQKGCLTQQRYTNCSGTFHYVTNQQGDVIAIVNKSGERVVEYTYDAWGNVLSITGTFYYNLGIHNPILYRGYIYDHETNLYYCQSRYYDPKVGRFINADTFTSTGQGVLGNNMFAYCLNNPVMYIDSTGSFAIEITTISAFLICVVVVVGSAATAYYLTMAISELLDWLASISYRPFYHENQITKIETEAEPPDVTYPGDNPEESPGEDYEWKGQEPKGGDKGSWVNKKTGEQLHPDLNHEEPVGPHWDYTNGTKPKKWWRIFPDGHIELRP